MFSRLTTRRAFVDCHSADAKLARKIEYRTLYAAMLNGASASRVAVLHFARNPAAIAWLVIAIVILPLNCMAAGRPLAHVGQEVFKRVEPAIANTDSSPPVIRKGLARGIVAPGLHAGPNFVLSGLTCVVRDSERSGYFALQAAAATRSVSVERCCDHSSLGTAITPAMPCGKMLGVHSSKVQYGPSTEPLACQVLESCMRRDRMTLSHDTSFVEKECCGQSRPALVALRSGSFYFNGYTQNLEALAV